MEYLRWCAVAVALGACANVTPETGAAVHDLQSQIVQFNFTPIYLRLD
jgi:hypothetical protein